VYSSGESLHEAIETGRGVYYSRSRGEVWRKGQHSGNIQELLSVRADCDRDALLFTVRQHGDGFCHTGSKTCFGEYDGLDRLQETLMQRLERSPPGSYTAKLLGDRGLIASKLLEEAGELLEARTREEITHEAADLLYFLLVRALSAGVRLSDIEQELDGRARRVTRRPGNAKPRSQEKTS